MGRADAPFAVTVQILRQVQFFCAETYRKQREYDV